MVERKRLRNLPTETNDAEGTGWLDEDGAKADGEHLIGSPEERARALEFLGDLQGVDFSKGEMQDIIEGKMTSEQMVREDMRQYDTYVDRNAELPQDIIDANVEHLEEESELRNRAQAYRIIKESPEERSKAVQRSILAAGATDSLKDDEFVGSREQIREMSEQATDPSLIPGMRGYVEEYGQFEMELQKEVDVL